MTLTIEQVQNSKFHLARRGGYEPVDVDNFVDRVEETLIQLHDENETLKKQVETLRSGGVSGDPASGDAASGDEDLRAQLAERDAEIERLRAQLEQATSGDLQPVEASPAATTAEGEGRVERIVVTAASDAAPAVTKLVQMATEQADTLVGDAREEASRIVQEAQQNRDRMETEANEQAARVTGDAQRRADDLDQETTKRRDELFGTLESERSELTGRIAALRAFEQDFRLRFADQLQGHIDNLRNGVIEPVEKPDLVDEEAPESRTPRLDALLARESKPAE
ncbi:DivIVA domain-containing protein [Nigerium massiliense]|uniref:DivIVA domain-containing protein n=1 Tax=Nigerium massiliense TaxID=1522317 RepID=UPI00058CDFD8|nr:DivIVA domain-containing protein [Nigerium massiliense]